MALIINQYTTPKGNTIYSINVIFQASFETIKYLDENGLEMTLNRLKRTHKQIEYKQVKRKCDL